MVEISPTLSVAINLAAFAAFVTVGIVLLYIGKTTHPEKKLSFPWVNLVFGTLLMGANYLVQAIFSTQISGDPTIAISSYLLIIGGAALSFTSFLILYVERSNEANILRERQNDLKEIMSRLRKKFLSREIPEEDIRKIDTDLVRELAEIEVKLEKIRKKTRA